MSDEHDQNSLEHDTKLNLRRPVLTDDTVEAAPKISLSPASIPMSAGLTPPASGITLKKPGENTNSPPSAGGLTLKKPGEIAAAGGLTPPAGGISLRKPGEVAAPGALTPPAGISLRKPDEAAATGGLTPPASGITLKKPGDASLPNPLAPPTISPSKKPPEPSPSAPDPVVAPGIELKKPSEIADSKLAAPGNLELKKSEAPPLSSGMQSAGSGLRLRKPSETSTADIPTMPGIEPPVELAAGIGLGLDKPASADLAQGTGLVPPGPGAISSHDDTTLDLKLKKPDESDNPGNPKLGLTAPQPTGGPQVLPPGLEPPAGADASDKLETPSNTADVDAGPISIKQEGEPADQIQFARKAKKKLSKQQKIQLAILAPIGVAIIVLGGIFLWNLFSSTKSKKLESAVTAPVKKAAGKKPDAVKNKPQEEEYEPAPEIPFPEELIVQLEAELGEKEKTNFLEEWEKLINYERKKYLIDIGVWEDSYEVPDGVLALHFDEAEDATVFADSSGYNNDASCDGESCPKAGKQGLFGRALYFDGKDDYIRINSNKSLKIQEKLTIEFWFRAKSYDNQSLIIEWSAGDKIGVHMMVKSTEFQWRGKNAGVNFVDESGNVNDNLVGVSTPSKNKWQYMLATYSNTSGLAKLYLNGKLANQKKIGDLKLQTGFDIMIGASQVFKDARYNGLLDGIAIYNRILTKDEISKRYARGRELANLAKK